MSIDPKPQGGLKAPQDSDEWICLILGVNIHIIFTVTHKRDVKSKVNSISHPTLIDAESLSEIEYLHVWWLLDIAKITRG